MFNKCEKNVRTKKYVTVQYPRLEAKQKKYDVNKERKRNFGYVDRFCLSKFIKRNLL